MKQKIAELINILFGMRKFIIMLMLYLVGISFRLTNLLSGAEMVDLFKATTIAFFGANGVEHLVLGVKAAMANKNQPNDEDSTNLVPADSIESNTDGK